MPHPSLWGCHGVAIHLCGFQSCIPTVMHYREPGRSPLPQNSSFRAPLSLYWRKGTEQGEAHHPNRLSALTAGCCQRCALSGHWHPPDQSYPCFPTGLVPVPTQMQGSQTCTLACPCQPSPLVHVTCILCCQRTLHVPSSHACVCITQVLCSLHLLPANREGQRKRLSMQESL